MKTKAAGAQTIYTVTEDEHTAGVLGLRSGPQQPVESHRSTNMVGESGRVVSRSVIAFHSLTQLCSDVMQLS